MAENTEEKKIKKNIISELKKKFSGNNLFVLLIVIMVACYMFFFSSSYIFKPSEDSLNYTNTNETQAVGNQAFTISQWIYSKSQNKMQVSLVLENDTTNTDISSYDFSSMTRTQSKSVLENPCNVVYSSSSMQIIDINNIPEKFAEVSLAIDKTDKTFDTDIDVDNTEIIQSTTSNSDSSTNTDSTTIYTNMYKVKQVDNISKKSAIEYEIDRQKTNQNQYKKIIDNANKQIKSLQNENKNMEKKIDSLENEKKYCTTTEYKSLQQQQEAYRNAIKNNNDSIISLQDSIKENEKLSEEIKLKIIELERNR